MPVPREPDEADWARINSFQMPDVYQGCPVVVFKAGDVSTAPKGGIINKVEGRTVRIRLIEEDCWMMPTDSLFHVDDPRLEFHNVKNRGTWDIAPVEKKRREKMELLEKRLAALESGAVYKPTVDESEDDEKPIFGVLTPAIELEITRMTEEGKSPTVIAEILGAGWDCRKVGKAVKKIKAQEAEKLATVS